MGCWYDTGLDMSHILGWPRVPTEEREITKALRRFFFFLWSQQSWNKTFLFFDKCSRVSDQIIIWSIRFQAEGEIGVPHGKERLEAKKKTYKNLHQKMIPGLKRNRRCEANAVSTAPHGPSKTRGSWGESWQNRGRMGQALGCRPDHKIKAGPTARKRWKFIELTDRNLVHENNSPTKWPSIVHSLTVQSNEAVRRISQFHISTGSMLKGDKQMRTVKRKSSRKGNNGSGRLTKRLINKK